MHFIGLNGLILASGFCQSNFIIATIYRCVWGIFNFSIVVGDLFAMTYRKFTKVYISALFPAMVFSRHFHC